MMVILQQFGNLIKRWGKMDKITIIEGIVWSALLRDIIDKAFKFINFLHCAWIEILRDYFNKKILKNL
jgi:hypothetical protein